MQMVPSLSPGHVVALATVASMLRDAHGPWWIIAGAAVALHGGAPIGVDDIDVLLSEADVDRVAVMAGVRRIDGATQDRFRSAFYAGCDAAGVRIEFMAGFRAFDGRDWHPVLPSSREAVTIEGVTVFVPDRDERIAMLARFGRAKDRERIALLRG